jgi:FkbM family methyltransferase
VHKVSKIIQPLAYRILHLYKLYVRRDPFLLEVRRWFKDKGDETLRLNYPLDTESVVVDVGGYQGAFADAIHQRYGSRVFIFEPVAEFYEQCVQRFSDNSRIRIFNHGLGGTEACLPIELAGDGSHFVLNANVPSHHAVQTAVIKPAAKVFDELDLEHIDLIKINIEGGEYELLAHLIDSGWVERTRFLQIQFHHFVPNARTLRDGLRERLTRSHEQMWNYEFVWESWKAK